MRGDTRPRALRSLAGALALAASLGVASGASAQLVTDPGTWINVIHSSQWTPASPDPSGITYRPDTGELLTCDAEVEEVTGAGWHNVNVWTHTTTGVVTDTYDTTPYSTEPTGIVFDPAGGRLWISDDISDRVYQIDFGPDGVFGTADDVRTDLREYPAAGCTDLEGIGFDNLRGHLWIASGGSGSICRIEPGPNGVFDGAMQWGDDVITSFDVASQGINDAEGIVYDPFWDTLVIADRSSRDLWEATPTGNVLRRIDVNFDDLSGLPPGSPGVRPAGVTIAPGTTNPSLRNYYVADRAVDNGPDPDENDGRVFEVVAIPLGGNGAPVVDAGPSQTLEYPDNVAQLDGFVGDDGHPYPPSTVTALWSKQSGPGTVTFGDANQPDTTATFSEPGSYVLQLVGDDSDRVTMDTVTIEVSAAVTLSVTTVGNGSVTLDPPGGSYTAGESVTLTAVAEAGAVFAGWSGDLSGTTNPQTLLMDGNKSVTATFEPLYDLTVTVSGPGSVQLSPAGGSYTAGTVVTLTAVPAANAVFAGWGGALSGTNNPETLTITGHTEVSATFTQLYTVSTATTGPGTVTLDPPTGPYAPGTIVTVTATPDPDAVFVGWSGDLSGSANPESLLVDSDKSVAASFATLYDVTLQATGPGSVTLDPPGGTYPAGTVVTVTATPGPNAVFDGFTGDLTGTTTPQPLTVDADKTVNASFTQHYTVTVNVTGPGTVTLDPPTGPYAPGTIVQVTAAPGPNAVFDGFTGDLTGTTTPQPLTVDADKTVNASFTQHYTVTVNVTGPGTVTLDPPGGLYAPDTIVQVTATPDPDAVFQGFGGDLTGTASPQALIVDADKSVTASFAALHSVTIQVTGPGSVSLDPPGGVYAAGTVVSVTATPDPFAVFEGFGGDLSGTATPQPLTVDADKTVTASFTLPSYTLSVTTQGSGTVTVDPPTGPYEAGSSVTLTATPATGWTFEGWSGDVVSSENPLLLLMDADKAVQATFKSTSSGSGTCGIGPELAALMPALGWLWRRRRGSSRQSS